MLGKIRRGGCNAGRWRIALERVQGIPPPEGFRIEHVDAGDAVRLARIIQGQLDRPDGLKLLQKVDKRIGLHSQTFVLNCSEGSINRGNVQLSRDYSQTWPPASELHLTAWALRAFFGSFEVSRKIQKISSIRIWKKVVKTNWLAWFPCMPCFRFLFPGKSTVVEVECLGGSGQT